MCYSLFALSTAVPPQTLNSWNGIIIIISANSKLYIFSSTVITLREWVGIHLLITKNIWVSSLFHLQLVSLFLFCVVLSRERMVGLLELVLEIYFRPTEINEIWLPATCQTWTLKHSAKAPKGSSKMF